jgi:hypothetical protein
MTEVIRRAVLLYETILNIKAGGGQFIHSKDGRETTIIIP